MRILDKNNDFYDYLQNIYRDTSVTFDRTDSFVITKELMCNYLQWGQSYRSRLDPIRWILLQVCNTFWLFVVEITEFKSWDQPVSYKVDLVSTWKNYNKPRCLIELSTIEFSWGVAYYISNPQDLFASTNKDKIQKEVSRLVNAVDTNEYRIRYTFNKHTIRHDDGNHVENLAYIGVYCKEAPLTAIKALAESR